MVFLRRFAAHLQPVFSVFFALLCVFITFLLLSPYSLLHSPKRWLLLACLAMAVRGHAQRDAFSPNQRLSQLAVQTYTADNGLVSNNITSCLQAYSGFLWMTTFNGIMRFDGHSVEVYDRSNLLFLTTDAFYDIYQTADSTLWFVSQGSGVVTYKNRVFKPFFPEVLPRSIRCLWFDQDGTIWLGTNNNGLYRYRDNSMQKVEVAEIASLSVLDIVRYNNTLWLATDGQGLFRQAGTGYERVPLPGMSNRVTVLHVVPSGALWIGTDAGLFEWGTGTPKLLHAAFTNLLINDLRTDARHQVWIGTENGLGRFAQQQGFEFLPDNTGRPFARINNICFDREGCTWLSTGRDGLVHLRETSMANFDIASGLQMSRTNIVYEAPTGQFYIGSDGGHIDIYDRGEIRPFTIRTPLQKAGIRDICVDDKKNLWIASYRGILKINQGIEKLFGPREGFHDLDMRRILKDSRGNLWFGSRSGGVIKYDGNKVVASYNKTNGLASNYILSLEEAPDGSIYVGTHSGGLSVISPAGQVKTFHFANNDAGLLIFNIHFGSEGQVWVVGTPGIHYFTGNGFKQVLLDRPGKGETYFDWLEDAQKNVWITSNVGVIKILRADLDDYLAGKSSRVKTQIFNHQDGMRNRECTGATRALLSTNGKVWVPTIAGVTVIYPEVVRKNDIVPPVVVTRLQTDHASFDSTARVPPGNFRYIFSYAALSYLSPAKVQFQYKLEGVDQDWHFAGNKRQTEYTNLSPGTYSFYVKGSNNDGVWNEVPAVFAFTVLPFFYQTWWFFLAIVLASLLLLYFIYWLRLRIVEQSNAELRKVNSELDRFVYSASHDLRAPLASVLGLINVARLDKANIDEYLEKMEKSINRLDRFIHDIIDFSRNARTELVIEAIEFNSLVNEVMDDLRYLDQSSRIQFRLTVKGKDLFYSDRKRITIVLKNLISNSIKYHNPYREAPFVEVAVQVDALYANICVADNGSGIARQHLESIFKMFYRANNSNRGSGLGLYIVKETVDRLRGEIAVRSELDTGTTFEVTLPNLAGSV